MSISADLLNVQQRLTEARERYLRAELKLQRALTEANAGDLIYSLVAYAEEFGIDGITSALRASRHIYNLSVPQIEALIAHFSELSELSDTIDLLAADETRLRLIFDPQQHPIYYAQGRPFTVNPYVEATFTETGEVVPLTLVDPGAHRPKPTLKPPPRPHDHE